MVIQRQDIKKQKYYVPKNELESRAMYEAKITLQKSKNLSKRPYYYKFSLPSIASESPTFSHSPPVSFLSWSTSASAPSLSSGGWVAHSSLRNKQRAGPVAWLVGTLQSRTNDLKESQAFLVKQPSLLEKYLGTAWPPAFHRHPQHDCSRNQKASRMSP